MSLILMTFQVDGVAKINGLGKITPAENALVQAALPELSANIEKVCIFLIQYDFT
jgi:malate dehydrogenase